MDYEKAYKAALTTAKQWIKDGCEPSTKICLECTFPELRESEDERIRKKFLALIEWSSSFSASGITRKDVDEMTAYLEKQKEEEGYEAIPVESTLEYKLGFKAGKESEKQKEQKPVEKQDYSGLNDLERAILRGFLSAGVENVPVTIIKETALECLAQMNPAEWSDYKDKVNVPYCSSEPEWSEEDESCWNLIWDILDGSFTASKEGYKKAAAWFLKNCPKGIKSLRPSWKPSEEQMEALQLAIELAEREREYGLQKDIVDFVEQLKQLM